MIALTTPYLWYTTRATGLVALILFTMVVTLGTLVANRIGGTTVGRFEINELHRSLSMVAVVFLAIHIITTVLDSYVSTGIDLGLHSHDVGLQAGRHHLGCGRLRPDLARCGSRVCLKAAHHKHAPGASFTGSVGSALVTALVHAYMSGTDSRTVIGLVLVSACSGVVVARCLMAILWPTDQGSGKDRAFALSRAEPPANTRPVSRPFASSPRPPTRRGR